MLIIIATGWTSALCDVYSFLVNKTAPPVWEVHLTETKTDKAL